MNGQETVRWRPWGDDAFARAREEGKRIFLSISASWCHWCHVMDEESFTHPEVIRQIHSRFIPVRIDSDKRPDLNRRYNMGGWPTVAILDAEGELVAGETYLPTSQLLNWLASADGSVAPTVRRPAGRPAPTGATALDATLSDQVAALIERAYDRQFGGFGVAPKFPQPWAIEFALRRHARTGEAGWLRIVTHTLDAMQDGEIHDPVEGGFFRYATSDDWDHPHYEKLLAVNAHLLRVYLLAFRVTHDVRYRATARGIVDYFRTVLAEPDRPWFGGSQSADRDYYALAQEERLDAEAPAVDRTLYVDHNAAAVSALLAAAPLLDQPDYRSAAIDLIDYLWTRCRRPDGAMCHYDDGTPSGDGLLSDQVWMATALLDQFDATGDRNALDRADALAAVMERRLWDGDQGGYWDVPEAPGPGQRGTGPTGLLRVRLKPLEENAVAAMALDRLHRATGQPTHRLRAEQALRHLATMFAEYKHHAAPFGVALEQLWHPAS
jgi:uncharacterized protein YyaL (SSP411 family)